ncbi:X-ray repair cross-complementing protein 5 [Leptinotarsa decemlineata]|uniref:X-ray repair cross-complementing protein 5 n=1 Tax=Leptinotarsa decemlineata TaxID=7539 RepID=UPI003D306CE1
MPPSVKIDCGLIVFDVNSNKKEQLLSGLIKLATFKWFSVSKDVYRIILSNSKTTKNEKNFPNLHTTDIEDFSPTSVLECIENAQSKEGNWLDALLLAIHHLKEANSLPGLLTPQLLFFTSLDGSSSAVDENKVKTVIEELNENNIYLYIIGPDVEFPLTVKHPDDVSQCMKKLVVTESNKSLVTARRIVQNIKRGVICNVDVGINLFSSFKNPRGSQLWKVPMSFGSKLEIPCLTVKICRKEAPLRLIPNQIRKSIRVLAEDNTVEVSNDEIVRGVLRHGKFVKIEDADMFKSDHQRCFEIVGFTDKTFVPETYMKGEETFYVLPNNEMADDSCQAFYNLVDVLASQNKYGIIKRVYMNNNRAKYFALIPRPDLDPVCFIMVRIPYTNEMTPHKYAEPAPSKVKAKEDDVTRFLRSIDVSGSDPKVYVPLAPTMMLDPYLNRLVNGAAQKLLKREFDFEAVELNDLKSESSNKFLENLKQSWPTRDS